MKKEITLNTVVNRLDAMGRDMASLRVHVSGLQGDMKKTQAEIKELKWEVRIYDKELGAVRNEVVEVKKIANQILEQLDHFAKKVDVFDKRVLFHSHLHKEADEKIANHEKRIVTLEKAS